MGPGLMFVALPYAFGHMVFGDFFGLLFFIMVAGTALSSGLALLEPLVSWFSERFRWWRFAAVGAASGLIWLLGLVVILSLSKWSNWQWLGMGIFGWLEFLTANVLLPLGGWLIAVFVGWWLRSEVLRDELINDPHWLFFLWHVVLRYIAAPAVLLILVASLYQRLAL
jgi:NSS family neurotransmitter:Na+ symporter